MKMKLFELDKDVVFKKYNIKAQKQQGIQNLQSVQQRISKAPKQMEQQKKEKRKKKGYCKISLEEIKQFGR